ncbi:MAG: DEAD/DEAH box helicase [Ectothiorhodospiraceae bacterium]|nr:DEAD/DEAH box helicase [Ectothiorhodospiraceae bacterium]
MVKGSPLDQTRLALGLTPAGRLVVHSRAASEQSVGSGVPSGWLDRATRAFAESVGGGLFALAATAPDAPPPPEWAFWRDFGCRYLTALCRLPHPDAGSPSPVQAPDDDELDALVAGAPPMEGAEYLRRAVLRRLWDELDTWVRATVAQGGAGVGAWLGERAPAWRQVGRVCLHLAENQRDPNLPFAFLATYAPRLSRGGRVQYQPLGRALEEYAGARNREALARLLTPVHAACERSATVRELVESREIFHPLAWTAAEAYRFLRDVPALEESGLLVRVPDWWRRRPRPRVAVTIGDGRAPRLGAEAMLDFQVGVALGEDRLTPAEVRALLAGEDGLVQLRGQWVEVDRQRLEQALAHWRRVEDGAAGEGLSFVAAMRLLAGAPADLGPDPSAVEIDREWTAVRAGAWITGLLAMLREPTGIQPRGSAGEIRGSLRPYQVAGRDWLWLLTSLGLGACLADDMGLGKTVQVLSLLLALKGAGDGGRRRGGCAVAGPSLLVLPASLLANWKAEIARFAPTLVTRHVHPSELSRPEIEALAAAPASALAGVDLVLTTYGMLARVGWLHEVEWRLVILDEAQAIKNAAARQTRAVKRLRAGARIALTGTPVENRLSDLWSLFDFLCPGLLGSATRFRHFVKSLEARQHDRYAPLRNLVSPYVLRRLKTDRQIIADLPDKTEMKVFCGLTRRQAALYAKQVEALARALDGQEEIARRGLVLAALMRFKQICNHPSQLLGDGVFEPGESGKFERLRAIAEEIASRQERVLVFTQFRELTEPLASFLAEIFGREGLVLHGATAVGKRRQLVESFQADDGPPFLVLSLKAGGVGLNLTAASHVVHFDRWWNPAVENQATDRAFRIGQHRNVVVHKFVCRGTVEERIDTLIDEKGRLAEDLVAAGGEQLLTEMAEEELLRTVALDVERASVL